MTPEHDAYLNIWHDIGLTVDTYIILYPYLIVNMSILKNYWKMNSFFDVSLFPFFVHLIFK